MSAAPDSSGSETYDLSRRQALKTLAAATAAGTVGAGASRSGLSPIGSSRAGALDGSYVTPLSGFFGLLDSNTSDTNQTVENAIVSEFWQSHFAQKERAKETLGLTLDILDFAKDTLFSEAKLAAIEKINEGATQSEVESTALDAARKPLATYQKNLVTINNDLVTTWYNYFDQLENEVGNFYKNNDWGTNSLSAPWYGWKSQAQRQRTLVDGTTAEIKQFAYYDDRADRNNDLFSKNGGEQILAPSKHGVAFVSDYKQWVITLGDPSEPDGGFKAIFDVWHQIETYWDDPDNGGLKQEIKTWVANAYNSVQSGEINPADLLTEQEYYDKLSEDEDTPMAQASLRLLNIPTDVSTTANIRIAENENWSIEVNDAILATGSETTVSADTVIDPTADGAPEYITNFKLQKVSVDWTSEVSAALDGGTLTVNTLPFGDADTAGVEGLSAYVPPFSVFTVETAEDETATFVQKDLTYDSNNSNWSIDLSDQLENSIVDVESVKIYPPSDAPTDYVSAYINRSFKVLSLNSDGEKVDSVDYKKDDRDPHTTDNYMTDEEWETRMNELDERIDKIESVGTSSSGLNIGGGFAGVASMFSGIGQTGKLAVIAVLAFFGFSIADDMTDD